jgi:hypothetical protein
MMYDVYTIPLRGTDRWDHLSDQIQTSSSEAEPSPHRRRRKQPGSREPTEHHRTTDAKTPDGVDSFPPSLPPPPLLEIRA